MVPAIFCQWQRVYLLKTRGTKMTMYDITVNVAYEWQMEAQDKAQAIMYAQDYEIYALNAEIDSIEVKETEDE